MIIIIGILAAIAIPMFLNQRDKAKDSAVKEGVHSIQIGVQSYAVDTQRHRIPADCRLTATLGRYVDNWPKNPWSATGDGRLTRHARATTPTRRPVHDAFTSVGLRSRAGTRSSRSRDLSA